MDLGETGCGDVDWIGLAQTIGELGFHTMMGNYRVPIQVAASRVELNSIELVSS
jgi:hypothetical protein